ncbi:MAG: AraC family transcriptional regulator ligand-binding domain-containing protein [Paracoccaceae bacterium]|nr:AraC family transcriptional regulator ligand-binding domain-containing protein [Paracoccaceae bacterium]
MPIAGGDLVTERTLTVLAEAARRAGRDPDTDKLAPTRYEGDGLAYVPAEEYRAVLQQVFSSRRPTIGIELARNLPVDATGLWGFLLRSSPTFGDMLHRAARYMRVFYRYTSITLTPSDDGLRLTCDHPSPSPFGRRDQELCFFLGQWLTWGRGLIGPEIAAESVRMRWTGPDDPAPVDDFFGCPVTFGAGEDSVLFSRDLAARQLPERTSELAGMFEDYAAAIIRRVDPGHSLVDQVREVLTEALLRGAGTEAQVAEALGITRRTLRRRLAEAGLTFRQIRRDLQRQRAERMLREGRLPIAEISYILGYSEPSTFHRAFRGWTGRSPASWRSEQPR